MADRLTCTLKSTTPVAVLEVTGTLNLLTSLDARAALHKSLAGQPSVVAVDMSRLTVAEDLALTVFAAFSRAAEAWPGCRTLLYAPAADVRAALDRLAVARAVPVHATWGTLLDDARAEAPPRRYSRTLPPARSAPRTAREFVASVCAQWRLDRLADDAELVATELVSNAVRHTGGGDVLLSVVIGGRFLHIAVRDGDATPPRVRSVDPATGEGGRGLLLVEAVTAGWGTTPAGGGKVVWATLRLP